MTLTAIGAAELAILGGRGDPAPVWAAMPWARGGAPPVLIEEHTDRVTRGRGAMLPAAGGTLRRLRAFTEQADLTLLWAVNEDAPRWWLLAEPGALDPAWVQSLPNEANFWTSVRARRSLGLSDGDELQLWQEDDRPLRLWGQPPRTNDAN